MTRQVLPTSLLFPLLIFMIIAKAESRIFGQPCSSSCGEINNITYPFRLNTDPAGCGDSDYELSCQDGKPILEFHSGKYIVKQINYFKHIIRVVDVNLANGTCSLPYKSLSLDAILDDSRYRGVVSNTYTSFVKCSGEINDQAHREAPCLSGNGSYVYVSYENYIIPDLQGFCSFLSMVPTIYDAVKYPSYESILSLMQAGFDLGWSVECRDCTAVGGTCTLSSWEAPYIYHCYYSGVYIPTLFAAVVVAIFNVLFVINLIARFILAPIVIIGFLIYKRKTTKKMADDNKDRGILLSQQSLTPRRYSYSDIISITSNFNDKLGQGGFGIVYKGQLPGGSLVAVKLLANSKVSDEDFINEVSTIGRIRHVNVMKLVGFCSEASQRALVMEYMPNGSLDKYVFSRQGQLQSFTWEKLLQIALGTARGIEHLHGGCDVSVIHFDIKPHNVLLDHNFTPKVSDFGLAKFSPKENDIVSVNTARGTMGYIAPEILSGELGAVSCKSDVYSFGMLLLEMVRARRNIDSKGKCSSDVYFPSWVYEHLNEGGGLELENVTDMDAVIAKKLCIVGLWCIQKKVFDRPSMTEVVQMLDGNVDNLQLPSNELSFPQHVSAKDSQSNSSTELLIPGAME